MSWWGWEGERVRGWEGERVRGWEGERGYNTFHTTSAALRLIALVTQTSPSASPVVVSVKYWKREETGMKRGGEDRKRKEGKKEGKRPSEKEVFILRVIIFSDVSFSAAPLSKGLMLFNPLICLPFPDSMVNKYSYGFQSFSTSFLSFKYLVDSCLTT